jgi:hypothetical protein
VTRFSKAANESQHPPELNQAAKGFSHPVYSRRTEHTSDALLLLERLRQAARDGEYPSTAELQSEGKYGLRPVNRLGDLVRGKYNGTRYDIERLDCSRGVYRWRLHEPARPGYPKDKPESPKQNIPWDKRKPVTGLELFDAAVR